MNAVPEIVVDLKIIANVSADVGEGPIWDDETETMIFVDSTAGLIYRISHATAELTSMGLGQMVGAAIPRRCGGLVACASDGLLSVEDNGSVSLLIPIEEDLSHRMNDAKCDSHGRLWSGTFSLTFEKGAGALYRIDPDLAVTKVFGDVTISNGLGWSPDEKTFYFVDTGKRGIDAFDYDIETGEVSNRRRFVDIERSGGLPDGIAVDSEGCLWVALYYGGAVRRYSATGKCVGKITLPVARVTSCNFGGPNLDLLYITTANHLLDDDGKPHENNAGATFCCRPGVTGLRSHRFAG